MKMVASGCSSTAGASISAPSGRSSRDQTFVSCQAPSNQTGRVPFAAFVERGIRPRPEGRQIEMRAAADGGGAQRDDAHRNAWQQPAEGGGVSFVEGRAHDLFADASAAARERDRQRHRDRMCLPEIMHVEFELDVDALDRDAGGLHHRLRFLARRHHARIERAGVEAVGQQIDRLHLVVAQVGDDAAERRGDAGKARHHRAFQADLLDHGGDVQRAAAAERHGRELGRVMAALDRDQADGAGHARIGDAHDRLGRLHQVELQRLARHGSRIARLAASTSSSASLPPIGRAALMRPSTTWASVSVGRSLPWP